MEDFEVFHVGWCVAPWQSPCFPQDCGSLQHSNWCGRLTNWVFKLFYLVGMNRKQSYIPYITKKIRNMHGASRDLTQITWRGRHRTCEHTGCPRAGWGGTVGESHSLTGTLHRPLRLHAAKILSACAKSLLAHKALDSVPKTAYGQRSLHCGLSRLEQRNTD